MFIENDKREIVNLDYVLALSTMDMANTHIVTLHTAKRNFLFSAADSRALDKVRGRIEAYLYLSTPRWAYCKNWLFRANKIMYIDVDSHAGITVYMDTQDQSANGAFFIPCPSDDEKDYLMAELRNSLGEQIISECGSNLRSLPK